MCLLSICNRSNNINRSFDVDQPQAYKAKNIENNDINNNSNNSNDINSNKIKKIIIKKKKKEGRRTSHFIEIGMF